MIASFDIVGLGKEDGARDEDLNFWGHVGLAPGPGPWRGGWRGVPVPAGATAVAVAGEAGSGLPSEIWEVGFEWREDTDDKRGGQRQEEGRVGRGVGRRGAGGEGGGMSENQHDPRRESGPTKDICTVERKHLRAPSAASVPPWAEATQAISATDSLATRTRKRMLSSCKFSSKWREPSLPEKLN